MATTVAAERRSGAASLTRMQSLDHNGHRLRYVDAGSGEPIVFVHNGGISHRLWDHQLTHFVESHRVVAPDLLGWGESDRPEIRYSADEYVGELAHLADHLDLGEFHLVGSCLGGGVALEFARRYPERVRSMSALSAATPKTIAAGPFGVVEAVSQPASLLRNLLSRACETPPGRWLASRLLYRLQCGRMAAPDPSFREHVRDMYSRDGQWRVFCNTDYSGFAALDEELATPREYPPTLMLWGGKNVVLPASAGEELARAMRADRVEIWDDCGYLLMRERADDANRMLREFIEDPRA